LVLIDGDMDKRQLICLYVYVERRLLVKFKQLLVGFTKHLVGVYLDGWNKLY
jgi:hypothetical protein